MRRKRIYRIGVVVIIVLVLQYPISLLIFGKKVNGVVVETVNNGNFLDLISGASSIPQVIFHYKDSLYKIQGIKDQKFEPGDRVKVVFFEWEPEGGRIVSFSHIFLVPTIELPLGLLIWWALFKSFPNLFETALSKKQYANLLIKGRLRKEQPILRSVSGYFKLLIILGLLLVTFLFLYLIWITINATLSDRISIQMGVGISLVIIIIMISLIQKIING